MELNGDREEKKKLKMENARLAGTEMRDFLIFCNLDGIIS